MEQEMKSRMATITRMLLSHGRVHIALLTLVSAAAVSGDLPYNVSVAELVNRANETEDQGAFA